MTDTTVTESEDDKRIRRREEGYACYLGRVAYELGHYYGSLGRDEDGAYFTPESCPFSLSRSYEAWNAWHEGYRKGRTPVDHEGGKVKA